MRCPVSVEVQLEVTPWRLATNPEFGTLSAMSYLEKSSVRKVVTETCCMITTHFLFSLVQIPYGERLNEDIAGFEQERGFT